MKGQSRYYSNSDKASEKLVWKSVDNDNLFYSEDSDLFETISEYMKARLDIEDAINDPGLAGLEGIVKEMISDYNKNKKRNEGDEKFIRDVFVGELSDEKIEEEIRNIKDEINSSRVNEISAEWVQEWHEKRQRKVAGDPNAEEIRNFITSSLQSDQKPPEIIEHNKRKKGLRISLPVRYISLSAAAVLGAFFLIKTLLPSYNPDNLFNSYYEPLNAISPVTRNVNKDRTDIYSSAIVKYKSGDYQTAAIGFSDAMLRDTSVIAPRFFFGITQVALGNFDQAINLLSDVTRRSGEYGKEARWYLGLAYLKTGDKDKASDCFKILAKTSGFYSERAEKILLRLK